MASNVVNKSGLRILKILHAFQTHRYGLTAKQLVSRSGGSIRTLYNDIATLKAAGYDFEKETVYFEGEDPVMRIRLIHSPVRK